MASKIKGERRLDLSNEVTAADIGDWLDGLDSLDLDRSNVDVSIQFKTGHVGTVEKISNVRNGLTGPQLGGLELVATWED